MSSDVVTTERIGSALVATIDRESSGNAINREVVAGLAESVREAKQRKDLRRSSSPDAAESSSRRAATSNSTGKSARAALWPTRSRTLVR